MLLHPQWGIVPFSQIHVPAAAWGGYYQRVSASSGGGAYPRAFAQAGGARIYRVRKLCASGEFATITQALAQWQADKEAPGQPRSAVIEIGDSGTYHEAPHIRLDPGEHLQLRAASMARPVLRLFDSRKGVPEPVRICCAPGASITLDGLLVTGGGIEIEDGAPGGTPAHPQPRPQPRCSVTLRHCTLVPGWESECANDAPWCGRASVMLRARGVSLSVEHSIVGPIRVARLGGMLALHVRDSIVDAGHPAGLAIADEGYGAAPAAASFSRATVIGVTQVEELPLAENSVFLGPLLAARRDAGTLRFCYLEEGSRTPRRVSCQPERAVQPGREGIACAPARVRPAYLSLRYGMPGYCQLAPGCPLEISEGAGDAAGMGAMHAPGTNQAGALRRAALQR